MDGKAGAPYQDAPARDRTMSSAAPTLSGSAPLTLRVFPAEAIESLRTDLGLSMKDLQIILDTTASNIRRWTGPEQAWPQRGARQRLAELMALHEHLGDAFTSMEGARLWLNAPSRYLAGMTPLEAMRGGRIDRARVALMALDGGVYL